MSFYISLFYIIFIFSLRSAAAGRSPAIGMALDPFLLRTSLFVFVFHFASFELGTSLL
jgi:hypothetical protein